MTTTPFVRPDVAAFLRYINAMPGPKMHELDAIGARAQMLATKDLVDPPVGALAVIRDLAIPGLAGAIPARLFDAAERRAPGPAMVFYHGGGFVVGDLDTHASLCAEAARLLDMPVVSVDYRLAPEHGWPAAPDDCEAGARWVAGSPSALGFTVTGLVLCGDSAGGNLAIVTALALRDEPAAVPVLIQAPIYPATDMVTERPSFVEFGDGYLLTREGMVWFNDAYRADLTHQRASPLNADLDGLPAAVVITAGLDPLRDQGRAYAARLVEAGVPTVYQEAAGNIHGFANLRQAIPSSARDVTTYFAAVKQAVAAAESEAVAA